MEIKAVINEKYENPEIHVCNHEMNTQVKNLINDISAFINKGFTAKDQDGEQVILQAKDIISVYAENTKVFIKTNTGLYSSSQKLYELEEEMDQTQFIRISKSEIVNLKKIKRLDLSMTGTIRVIMSDDSESFTSRRNVTKLKKALGV